VEGTHVNCEGYIMESHPCVAPPELFLTSDERLIFVPLRTCSSSCIASSAATLPLVDHAAKAAQ
jgi:hypothetical protein